MTRTPKIVLLTLAVSAALVGCGKTETPAKDAAASAPATAEATTYKLDESKLPAYNAFQPSDLDTTKDACTAFGDYVNSKWLAANEIPGDRTSWGAFTILDERSVAVQHQLAEQVAQVKNPNHIEKIVGDLWATGMDEAKINAQGIEPLKADLAAIDGLQDKAAIANYLRTSAAKGDNVLFGFGAEADFKNSTMNMAYASQGGLGLPDTTYYTDAKNADKLKAYQAHVAKVLELSGVAAADAAKQAEDVVKFETRLAKASKSRVELSRNVELYYNPVTLADADKLTPNFSWTEFFKSQGVAAPEKFSLAMPAFHEEVSKALGDTDPSVWRAYLRFHTVDSASPYLADAFVQENYEFYGKTLNGQKEQKPRWKRVLGTIENDAGEAFGQLYVKVAFSPEAKAKMEELVKNLAAALKDRIQGLSWMSEETKAKAIAKWETFTPKIGYPDKWRDWSGLQTQRDSFLGNVRAANEFNYKFNLSKIGKPVDKTEWGMTPQTVNAYYNPLQNEIVFPAAILQPPFFDPKADDALNYGGIGAVIGHEMTHGYDDQGARFGPTGNMEDWWTPADKKNFEGLTGKLVKQFDQYKVDGQAVNGHLTLGENIADLGGLATAYDALQKASAGKEDAKVDGFTRDQRFFFNWATVWRTKYTPENAKVRLATDPHAPAQFRAMGAPSNLPTFAAAFQCKAGSPMARTGEQQVVIW
ncbi:MULTISPECIES: M13 family metallopeptidase [Stenotrophomonas]|uniref:M13 family metallopeptidase n=2 Tax=Lysobacteraceae TaxID=32033 RepID=UPI000D4F669E|nr:MULTISPECIES: M13-type metalloendopeptidase [Stenotrophomonas]QCZ97949.1 peptidase [Stenotrophomonas sp. pho]MBA0225664.1 peptidase [Stenotrophomonas maltophilia]MBA0365996.1 peptidase [Stenotrophomonas maltophilia]MBA0403627.1 peptidase [Stenotrophomonas maltophilia]MCF3469458.1 peptidase [Stenotrophomonas maltophilia]